MWADTFSFWWFFSLTQPTHTWLKFLKMKKKVRPDSMLLQVHLSPTTAAGKPIQSTCLPDRVEASVTYKGQQLLSELNSPFGKIRICTIELLMMEKWKVPTCVNVPTCPRAPTALTPPFINSINIFQVLYQKYVEVGVWNIEITGCSDTVQEMCIQAVPCGQWCHKFGQSVSGTEGGHSLPEEVRGAL